MVKILITVTVNGNEIALAKDRKNYFIHWGGQGKPKASKKITTSNGKRPSQASAHKQFLEAVEATKTLKFSKL